MRFFNLRLTFQVMFISSLLLTACSDDDDSGDGPMPLMFPNTIGFSNFIDQEFRMWANGVEINTAGLNYEDYIPDPALPFSASYFQNLPLTFTADSVFGTGPSGIQGYGYYISNDSIFVTEEFVNIAGDTINLVEFLGLGSPAELKLVQGYFQYCHYQMMGTVCTSNLYDNFVDVDDYLVGYLSTDYSTFQGSDTLLILNRFVVYN